MAPRSRSPRLAAHAVGPPARPAGPLPARRRDRGHRPWPRPRRALERADAGQPHLLGGAAFAAGGGRSRGSRGPASAGEWQLAILLHDAPEYVIGDIISPFKAVLGDGYKGVENRLLAAIHLRFGLPATSPKPLTTLAKTADHASAFLEATRLAGFAQEEALRFFGRPCAVPARYRRADRRPGAPMRRRPGSWRGSPRSKRDAQPVQTQAG